MKTSLHIAAVELAIMNIQRRKRAAGIVPNEALMIKDLFKELRGYEPAEIKARLTELKQAGRIKGHNTINDTLIEII